MRRGMKIEGRAISRSVRQALVGGCSLAVVAGMALYVLAPATLAYSFSEARATAGVGTVVIYGRAVDGHHQGVGGVEFVLSRRHKHDTDVVAEFDSAADGTYRFSAALPDARYTLVVTVRSDDRSRHHQRHFEIEPGTAYRIDIRVIRRGGFVFLPITSY